MFDSIPLTVQGALSVQEISNYHPSCKCIDGHKFPEFAIPVMRLGSSLSWLPPFPFLLPADALMQMRCSVAVGISDEFPS